MFAAPAIILFAAFLIIPIIYAIYLSFRGFRVSAGGAFGRREETFIGFENYITALTDTEFVAGLGRVLLYGAISIPSVLGSRSCSPCSWTLPASDSRASRAPRSSSPSPSPA
ncbi:hypothetical protein MAFF212519_28670 [Clavibacter michiganensis]